MEQIFATVSFYKKNIYLSTVLLLIASIPFGVYARNASNNGLLIVLFAFYVFLALYLGIVFIKTARAAFVFYRYYIVDNHRIFGRSYTIQKSEISGFALKEKMLRSGPYKYIEIQFTKTGKTRYLYAESLTVSVTELYDLCKQWYTIK